MSKFYKIYVDHNYIDNGILPNGINYIPRKEDNDVKYINKDDVIEIIKLCYGKVNTNPLDYTQAFEELLSKI